MTTDGTFSVLGTTAEGHRTKTTFHNAKVDMPILSVAQMCAKDEIDVKFNKKGGNIINVATGKTTRFVKRLGVYFLKLRVEKPVADQKGKSRDMGFVRPGTP